MKTSNYKRTIFSWSIYDFANQPFTTIILTFVYSRFFVSFIATEGINGTLIWTRAVAISSIIIALISPIMGAIADKGGYRKTFLIFWTWVCIIFSFFLYFPLKGDIYLAAILFCIANIGFEMGGVFLNAYLPEIAPKEKIGRISGYGWSFGYIGGLLALVICNILFMSPDIPLNPLTGSELNLETGENYRMINVFIAIWFAVFSIPTFIYVKEKKDKKKITIGLIKDSYRNVVKTFNELKKYKQTLRFLCARILYNDAIVTIFAMGSIYASETIWVPLGYTEAEIFEKIFLFGIILNVAAGLGAFLFGFIDDLIGGKTTIQITNLGFILSCLLAVIAPAIESDNIILGLEMSEFLFWISGCLIGVFSGPNQAASRSLMGRLTPKNKENEFYGFYAFSGKATAFIGPLLYGIIEANTGKHEYALLVVCFLFLCGFILLNTVDEKEDIKNPSIN